jgi:hypothetical protein
MVGMFRRSDTGVLVANRSVATTPAENMVVGIDSTHIAATRTPMQRRNFEIVLGPDRDAGL